jgi:hypothetical protein
MWCFCLAFAIGGLLGGLAGAATPFSIFGFIALMLLAIFKTNRIDDREFKAKLKGKYERRT